MKWRNLLDTKCPQCGEFLLNRVLEKVGEINKLVQPKIYYCSGHECDFSIRATKLEEMRERLQNAQN